MSRLHRFTLSLVSGYVQLGTNVLCTLVSVPLALHYLSKAEFGLWGLATKIGVFIALVDFGLSPAVARILIDHKDDPQGGSYGATVKTGFLVGATQGTLVLLCGVLLACFIGPWLHVEAPLQPALQWLLLGQCAMLALSFATRTFTHVLTAHQRFDIINYSQSLTLIVSLGVTWLCFALDQGVYSLLWGHVATVPQSIGISWAACVRLRLLPKPGQWGPLTWAQFKHVFGFGSDIFLVVLGALMISASQAILLTRLLGLEAVTVWSVCTRVYDVLQQVIFRILDYSSSALAEMIVRGEKALLQARFRQIVTLSASLSLAAGTIFVLCNSDFVNLWTSGRFESPQLVPGDIKAPQPLARRLLAHSDPAAQFLWDQFPAAARSQLQTLSTNEASLEALQTLLALELDKVVQGASLMEQAAFQRPEPAPPAAAAPGMLPTAWVNRHALEDAFPLEIADSRKARWSLWNDLLLAVWLVICVSLHSHTGLVGLTKAIGFLRYLFFIEGVVFVGLTVFLCRYGGITIMLLASVFCSLVFSFTYGLYRTRAYFGLTRVELAAWHRAPLRLAAWLLPVAALVAWLTHPLPPLARLPLNACLVGAWAGVVFLRYGLDAGLQQEMLARGPSPARALLTWLLPARLTPPAGPEQQRKSGD